MNAIDQIITDALAGSPETHVAILAREVVRLREAPAVVAPELTDDDLNRYSMDCDERDALEFGYKLAASRFASAGRTVIPPLTDDEIEERYRSLTNGTDELEREWCYKDCRWAYSLAVYRARVAVAGSMLGIGMRHGNPSADARRPTPSPLIHPKTGLLYSYPRGFFSPAFSNLHPGPGSMRSVMVGPSLVGAEGVDTRLHGHQVHTHYV